jgi:type II secretory pathway component PulK
MLPRQDSGSMLVLALIIILLMTVLAADVFDASMVEYEASVNGAKITRLEYALNIGLEIAKAHILQDGNDTDIDSLQDSWATPLQETIGGDSAESVKELASEQGPPKIELTIEIEDEESKWPLPMALLGNDAQLKRRREGLANMIDAFREDSGRDIDSSTANRMVEQFVAFMSRKENEPGVVPRPNTKSELHLMNVADLALIKDIDDDILYDSVDDKGNLIPGLLRFLTIWSDTKINVNTATLPVLRGLFRAEDKNRADDIYHYRTAQTEEKEREKESKAGQLEERSKQQDKALGGQQGPTEEERMGGAIFEKISDVQKIEGFPARAYSEAQGMMTVNSRTFSVWATAEMGPIVRQRHWVVRREGGRIIMMLSEAIDPDYRPRFRKARPDEEGRGGSFR